MILSDLFPDHKGDGAGETINGITADSRKIQPGFIFAAMQGVVTDGRKFIGKAICSCSSEGLTAAWKVCNVAVLA